MSAMMERTKFSVPIILSHLWIFGVVLKHGGHGVGVALLSVVVVVGRPAGVGLAPVWVEPEVVAVGEVDVRDVVHLVDGH